MRCLRVLIALLLVAGACAPATTDPTSPAAPVDVPVVDTGSSTSATATTLIEGSDSSRPFATLLRVPRRMPRRCSSAMFAGMQTGC